MSQFLMWFVPLGVVAFLSHALAKMAAKKDYASAVFKIESSNAALEKATVKVEGMQEKIATLTSELEVVKGERLAKQKEIDDLRAEYESSVSALNQSRVDEIKRLMATHESSILEIKAISESRISELEASHAGSESALLNRIAELTESLDRERQVVADMKALDEDVRNIIATNTEQVFAKIHESGVSSEEMQKARIEIRDLKNVTASYEKDLIEARANLDLAQKELRSLKDRLGEYHSASIVLRSAKAVRAEGVLVEDRKSLNQSAN